MAKRKIVWTEKANLERIEILEYWIIRNKSKNYSFKLNLLLKDTIKRIADNPSIGRKTDFDTIRVKVLRDYLLFYEFDDKHLKILSIWDSRRDENLLDL